MSSPSSRNGRWCRILSDATVPFDDNAGCQSSPVTGRKRSKHQFAIDRLDLCGENGSGGISNNALSHIAGTPLDAARQVWTWRIVHWKYRNMGWQNIFCKDFPNSSEPDTTKIVLVQFLGHHAFSNLPALAWGHLHQILYEEVCNRVTISSALGDLLQP